MTPTSPACRRTRAWIAASRATRLSVRVGDVLRRSVGPEGDAGQLNGSHVNSLFVRDNERTEAARLIILAKRWPRRGAITNGKNENSHYRMGDYGGVLMQEIGE